MNYPQQGFQQPQQPPQQPSREPVICVTQGRIIGTAQDGDLFKGAQKKNLKTGQLEVDPKSGLPVWNWVIILAIPKAAMQGDPSGIGRIWTEMWTEFQRKFPTNWQQLIDPRTGFPNPKTSFSMKCKDGDLAVDEQGKPYSLREGYKGCYVLTLSTRIPPTFFIPQGGQNVQVTEGIKVGDIVNVAVQVSSGDSGLYLNPKMVQLVERGAAIVSGPNADDVFGMAQPQRSQFIQSVPDPMANPATAFQGMGMPGAPAGSTVPPQYQQPAAPQPAAPNYGAVPQHFHPQGQQVPQMGNVPSGAPVAQQAAPYGVNGAMPGAPQGGQYDPNAVNGGGHHQPAAPHVGGSPTPQPGYAMNAGQPGNPYPTNGGNGQMPR